MSTFEYTTLLVVGCPLAFVALVVATVLILAAKADTDEVNAAIAAGEDRIVELRNRRLAMASDDPTPFEDDEPTGEILAVDPPVDRAYLPQVPAGMVLYRGGAVHPECAQRWLRFDLTPVDGCAVWLTDSLKETVT